MKDVRERAAKSYSEAEYVVDKKLVKAANGKAVITLLMNF